MVRDPSTGKYRRVRLFVLTLSDIGNDISHNGANGVNVREFSVAQISDNTLNVNGANGILAAQGSGVLLGAGNTIFTRPNATITNHAALGIRCKVAGYVDGRVGTLNRDGGSESYVEGCVPSLIR